MSHVFSPAFLAALSVLAVAPVFAQSTLITASLELNLHKPTREVSPMLYGLMTEEINFSYDRGPLR